MFFLKSVLQVFKNINSKLVKSADQFKRQLLENLGIFKDCTQEISYLNNSLLEYVKGHV